MRESDSLIKAINEDVRIVAYDPRWPSIFVAERDRLLELFPHRIQFVEHMGSTSVPGLAAKPIIDILAAVISMEVADALLEPLNMNGYDTSAEFNSTLVGRRWLMRHVNGRRTHHLHLVVANSSVWNRHIRFRDLLRSNERMLAEYEALKFELAEHFKNDRDGYTKRKSEFIERAINQNA